MKYAEAEKKLKEAGNMIKVKAFIERGNDGRYGAYVDLNDNQLNYGIIGDGKTVEEAKEDFMGCYEDMRELFKENGDPFTEAMFDFEYDVASFLNIIPRCYR